jgi:hypothetical protein
MKRQTRRRISLTLLIFALGTLLYSAVFFWQQRGQPPAELPLTLKEQLLIFISEEELTFDQSDPENLVLLWQDLEIKFGQTKNVAQKVRILKYLFPIIQTRYDRIEYVDIRFPENVVIKYQSQDRLNGEKGGSS